MINSAFCEEFQKYSQFPRWNVHLRPDRTNMGSYTRQKSQGNGVQKLLVSGTSNMSRFWSERYRDFLEKAGDLLTQRLENVSTPFCLMCAERSPAECHRFALRDALTVEVMKWNINNRMKQRRII